MEYIDNTEVDSSPLPRESGQATRNADTAEAGKEAYEQTYPHSTNQRQRQKKKSRFLGIIPQSMFYLTKATTFANTSG